MPGDAGGAAVLSGKGRRSTYHGLVRGVSKWSWLVGLFTLCYSGLGVWRPSFWTDEAATVSAVSRDLPELGSLLGTVDAVHGAYYYIMFAWTGLFGHSEVALRLPSLLAIAASAVLMSELGRRAGSLRFGILAAAFLVLLPRTQYVATDARSYALTVLTAIAATYVLVMLRNGARARAWAAYAAIGAVMVSLSFYCILLLAVHAIAAVLDPSLRRQLKAMALAAIAWLVPAAYIAAVASGQQFQIAWIRDVGPAFPFELAFLQFFSDGYFTLEGRIIPDPTPGEDLSMVALGALLWLAAGAGAILTRCHFITKLALLWLVLPPAAVIAGSLVTGGDYYLPRYLSFCLPALALLAASPALLQPAPSIKAARARAALPAVAIVSLLVALPSYVGQRTEFGRDPEDDFRFIAASVEKLGEPGDGLVLGLERDLAYQAYPGRFAGLEDTLLVQPAAQWDRIHNNRGDIGFFRDRILAHESLILVEKSTTADMAQALQGLGYTAVESVQGPTTLVTRYSKG